jgi:hypothetical protein
MNEKYIKLATQYLDQFYNTINNPNVVQKEFNYPCDKHGTGNVVIKGLRRRSIKVSSTSKITLQLQIALLLHMLLLILQYRT